MNKQERERATKLRPVIIKELERLEKRYGERLVTNAFNRLHMIRSERRKLLKARNVIMAKISKLEH